MPEERVVIEDPSLEGVAERIGFEESSKLGRRPGGPVRIVMARVTYKVTPEGEPPRFVTAALPKEIMASGLLAPSLVAHILTKKFRFGMPFTRLVQELASEGIRCDDSTMCRYAEHVGATLGCIVDACAKEARETAFCLSTDATGIKIQPSRHPEGKRQACARGHFFVVLADRDHVFFDYQESSGHRSRRSNGTNVGNLPPVRSLTSFSVGHRHVFERVRQVRGPVANAFGYALRQRAALCRFLDDGRLRLENNASERALRVLAVGRKAWMFCGSGVHAQAAANLFSLLASCMLHDLDP